MKMRYLLGTLSLAAFAAACSTDTITDSKGVNGVPGLRYAFSGAVNTDMYNAGTCTNVNGNIYLDQFTVGLDGSPSTLDNGSYYVRVTEPDGDVLGTSDGATFIVGGGTTCYQVWSLVMKESNPALQGFDQTTNPGGEYRLLISDEPTFSGGNTKNDNFKIAAYEDPTCEELENCPEVSSLWNIVKFYDANLNGIQDLGEDPIEGWQIDLDLGEASGIVSTTYTVNVDDGTAYTATELQPSIGTWVPTTLITQSGDTPPGGGTIYFGNVCLAGGDGHTLGFWSNKNGQRTMDDDGGVGTELTLLNNLPLANATGPQSNFASYGEFRTWILGATATNMAYMLSAQLAAMVLNVEEGFVDENDLVYAPDVDGANGAGFITIGDLIDAAIAALEASEPDREEQGDIKDALDDANNNENFLSATPCDLTGATWSSWPTVE
jgi:hypothetical protein